jgi:hypothetical protein
MGNVDHGDLIKIGGINMNKKTILNNYYLWQKNTKSQNTTKNNTLNFLCGPNSKINKCGGCGRQCEGECSSD